VRTPGTRLHESRTGGNGASAAQKPLRQLRTGEIRALLIFTEEAAFAGVPVPYLTLNTVGPTIMRSGTTEQARAIGRLL